MAGEDDRETQYMVKLHVAEEQSRELDQSKMLKPGPDEREADMQIQQGSSSSTGDTSRPMLPRPDSTSKRVREAEELKDTEAPKKAHVGPSLPASGKPLTIARAAPLTKKRPAEDQGDAERCVAKDDTRPQRQKRKHEPAGHMDNLLLDGDLLLDGALQAHREAFLASVQGWRPVADARDELEPWLLEQAFYDDISGKPLSPKGLWMLDTKSSKSSTTWAYGWSFLDLPTKRWWAPSGST